MKIDRFIFHIISTPKKDEEAKVIFLDEVTISDEQKNFFLDRLKETAEGNKYKFKEHSENLKNNCLKLVESSESFSRISRNITQDFSNHHGSRMAPGIFIVSEVSVPMGNNQLGKLIFLVKLDNKKTININYKEINGKMIADISNIPYALTENKSAVQKSALIDVNDIFEWDTLATDRYGPQRSTKLSEYFEGFLGVGIFGSPQSLTAEVVKTTTKWFRSLSADDIPDGLNRTVVKERALSFIDGNQDFDTDKFIDNIIREENEYKPDLIKKLKDKLKNSLGEAGIAGQKFVMDNSYLTKKQRQTKYKTKEGVEIIAMDGVGASVIEIEWLNNNNIKSGPAIVKIRTDELSIDE